MIPGGRPLHVLEHVRSQVPIVMHGVSLSIGSVDELNTDYLRELKALADRIEPAWMSDHLCWGGYGGRYAHDLLPMPYTEEALDHVAGRILQVQDFLGRQILIENVSSYVSFEQSTMTEWEFLAGVTERADCGILLDVNNIFVSAFNHGFDPLDYVAGVPGDRVCQIHLAGHTDHGHFLLDTHNGPVIDPVWDIYTEVIRRFGRVSTLIEWDEDVPEYSRLLAESERARQFETKALEAAVENPKEIVQ